MTRSKVGSLAEGGKWVRNPHTYRLTMVCCSKKERVCHTTKKGEEPFIYMYQTILLDLGVTLPFDFFEDVGDIPLPTVGQPSSLQGGVPGTWNTTFHSSFPQPLHHASQSINGLSVAAPLPNNGLFTSYTASSKGFKSRSVKIKATEAGYFCIDPRPLPCIGGSLPSSRGW
ncbi:hypothetical protein CR513_00528, partial [Mucuna pruriens]